MYIIVVQVVVVTGNKDPRGPFGCCCRGGCFYFDSNFDRNRYCGCNRYFDCNRYCGFVDPERLGLKIVD